jgi:uncharacterized membrane protein YGL010W
MADQARQALGASELRVLAEVPLPLVHTAFGAAVCAVAVLLRSEAIGLVPSAVASGSLAIVTALVLAGYDFLVYPAQQRPGLEGAALPVAAVVAFATVLAGVPPITVRLGAGLVAALVIGGVPQLVGRRALGREGGLARLLRDLAGIAILTPVFIAGVSPVLPLVWRAALIAAVASLVSYDALRTEGLTVARAGMLGVAVAVITAAAAGVVGASTSAGPRAAGLLVLWYGLRGLAGVFAVDSSRRHLTLLEYGFFVVVALAALRYLTN